MTEQNFSKVDAMLAHLRARGITVSISGGQFSLQAPKGVNGEKVTVGENDVAALRALLEALGLATEAAPDFGIEKRGIEQRAAAQVLQTLSTQSNCIPGLVDDNSPEKGAELYLPLVARDVEVLRHKAGAWFSTPLGVGATLFAVLLSRYQQREDWLREISVAIGQQAAPGEPPHAWFSVQPLVKRLPTESTLREAVTAVADGLLEAAITEGDHLDLALELPDPHDEDQLVWQYAADLFDEEFIRQLHSDFVAIMRQATALITPMLSGITLYGNGTPRAQVVSEEPSSPWPNAAGQSSNTTPSRDSSALWRSVQAVIDGQAAALTQPLPSTITPPARTHWPLSPQQWLFVLDEQKSGVGHRHNITTALWQRGAVDLARAQQALAALVRRHDILRTTFEWQDTPDALAEVQSVGHPAGCSQCVHINNLPLPWRAMVVSTTEDLRSAARKWLNDTAVQPLSLFAGQPWLASVATVSNGSETGCVWRLTCHNALVDAHAAEKLMAEWLALYANKPLAEVPQQYTEYSQRQQAMLAPNLQLDKQSETWAFWSERLQSFKPLQLPVLASAALSMGEAASREAATDGCTALSFAIEPELMQRVTVASVTWQVSVESILLTAFESVIRRYVNHDRFVVGVEFANRSTESQNELCGVVANVLPRVTQLDELRNTVRHLVENTHSSLTDMALYQSTPLVSLLSLLAGNRARGSQPPLVAGFACRIQSAEEQHRLAALGVEKWTAARRQNRYTLGLTLRCSADLSAEGELEFTAGIFDLTSADIFIQHYLHLLTGMVADGAAVLAHLPLMSLPQQQEVFDLFNHGAQCLPSFLPHFLMWWQRQCYSAPHGLAVVAPEGRLSFIELDCLANQIARYLAAQDIGTGDRVGVLLPRDPVMLATLLALFKVGAAYVPIHPQWPQEYQESVLQQAGVSCIVHDSERLPWIGPLTALDFAISTMPWQTFDSDAFEDADDTSALACILYPADMPRAAETSSEPQGVSISHRNLSALVAWGVRHNDHKPLIRSGFARDLGAETALFELFVTLGIGGAVVLIDDLLSPGARERPTSSAAKLLGAVNQLTLTPSLAGEMLERNALPPGVRTLYLAGEPVPGPLVKSLRALPNVGEVYALHTCRENTGIAFVTAFETPHLSAAQCAAAVSGVGVPVDGTQCAILGPHGQLQPWGIAGDLYIGGAELSSGYWGRTALTTQHFVRNPLAYFPTLGGTVFRTGYRACWYADGRIELLSYSNEESNPAETFDVLRAERQVQEALSIARCAVLTVENSLTHRLQKVAFVKGDLPARHYLQALNRELPENLRLEGVVVAGTWPRNTNDVLDRKTLAAQFAQSKTLVTEAAPNTLELQLQRLWQELLGEQVESVDTDFIAAGGHSLMALQLATQLAQRYSLQAVPSFSTLMQYPTPRRLARWLDAAMRGEESRITLWEPLVTRTADRSVLFFQVGETANPWHTVAETLDTRIGGYRVRYQPRENEDLAPLAQRYVDAIEQESLPLPCALVGHGQGGLLAAAVAHEMHLRGWPWLPVIMLDSVKQADIAPIQSRVLHVSSPATGIQSRKGWAVCLQGEIAWRRDTETFVGNQAAVGQRVARWVGDFLGASAG